MTLFSSISFTENDSLLSFIVSGPAVASYSWTLFPLLTDIYGYLQQFLHLLFVASVELQLYAVGF